MKHGKRSNRGFGARHSAGVGLRTTLVLLSVIWVSGAPRRAFAGADFSEGFDDVGAPDGAGPQNLVNQGWIFRNQSEPPVSTNWYQGRDYAFPYFVPQSGSGYLANTANWDQGNRNVSTWAILPTIPGQAAGDQISFYIAGGPTASDQIQVRYSPSGETSTGSGLNDVGDFSDLLITGQFAPDIGDWALVQATVPGAGRLAIRWYDPLITDFHSPFVCIDTLRVGPAPCDSPPIPGPGQSVAWTAAGGPYVLCSDLTIPASGTVTVEPGVQITVDSGFQLTVNGTLQLQGQPGNPISLTASASFPAMLEVSGGALTGSFTQFGGQVSALSGATVTLSDCEFAGFGGLSTRELQSITPFVQVERCTFRSSAGLGLLLVDALGIVRDNEFVDCGAWLLRGFVDVTTTNTFTHGGLSVTREESIQPFYLNGVQASGVALGAGLSLDGGEFELGPDTVLQNNQYTLNLAGGLTPDSTLPLTGNAINAINVGSGGFAGTGHWPALGLPYHFTEPTTSLPGGHLTIEPGVVVEAAEPGAALWFRSTRRGVLDGLPAAPITFRGLVHQPWGGLLFNTNSTTGCRLEYCIVQDAEFGVISSDNALYVDNCQFVGNRVGANANTFGGIAFRKTRFENNGDGVRANGGLALASTTNPNAFAGNTAAVETTDVSAQIDARYCWWGDPSGPQAPGNPDGAGDPIVGPGASGVVYDPILTSLPDFGNTPPVVRMIEPGLTQRYASPDYDHPDFLLDPGTKYIFRWNVASNDAVVRQRIEFSSDGHYQSRFIVLADDIPGSARSFEITVPQAEFAVTNQPQFFRIVAADVAGQEAWDEVPVDVPSGRVTGNLAITTNLSGQTFLGGDAIPSMTWTGSVSYGTVRPLVVLEADGAAIAGLNFGGQGEFFEHFPYVSTDSARLALQVRNNANDLLWFFAEGYFSIRPDPRLGLTPPSVTLVSPAGGETFAGGTTVPISWSATAPAGLRSFDIQASYDAGRTWHPIIRDLPASATDYAWHLPASTGIADVRVRVIVRDRRFQNSSDGADRSFVITAGQGGLPGDLDADGDVDIDDVEVFAACMTGPDAPPEPDCGGADLDGDGDADLADFVVIQASATGSE